ncbi:poly [ADP-ribose] polymerase 14 isoform X2 [Oryzias latipes]|uniref:poly [ADP-ribose] polymerase 14 isoform X2 n=1 Tax=Oryzias latipes TaxID=8090 RepID=UPI0005CC2E61|nr:poly [ADP-ribose] polymerase 14 isoform X2 [Oryzias latipes]
MAGEYSHRVVVELESGDVPKVKNKLVKYFQSRRSGGGDCQVDYEEGSRSAVLRFSREEDKKKVLDKETHQVQLEKGVLKMTARLPPEEQTAAQKSPAPEQKKKSNDAEIPKQELTDEADHSPDTEEEELCSTSAVLENISAETSQEFLEMLVENVLKGLRLSSQKFSLEMLPEISSAVVTFQTGADNSTFIKACPQNRMFNRKGLMVRSLELTKQVAINNEHKFNADVLQLYFDGKGGGVEDVLLNEEEQSAVITFTEPKGVRDVLKEKHNFKNKEIKVYPFYESLGVALYGKDKKILKLPATISEPLESAVFAYLKQNPAALESIRSDLEKHFCNVALDQAAVCLGPKPLLLKQKDSKTLIREWTNTVKAAFTQTMSKFKSTTFQLKPEAVEESERAIRQTLLKVPDEVILVPDKAQGVLSVAGLVDNVNALEKPIQEVINKTAQRVERQKLSKTQEVKVSPTVFHILCQDGFEDKLLSLFPELQMSFNKEKSTLKVTGLVDEIFAATKTINDSSFSLKRQSLDMEETLLDFLKGGEEVELTNSLLTAYDINAALEISANRVQLIAASEEDLMDAQEHLRQLLTSKGFVVEDADVLKMAKWKELVRQMEDETNSSGSRIQIQTTDQQVVVCGHKDVVEKVSFTLEEFLTQNARVDETVHVKANIIIKYFRSPEMPWLTELQKQVNVSFQKNTIHLSGSRAAVEEAKMSVESMLSSLVFDSLMVNKPGGKKFFLEKENMYLSSLKSETGCLVQLVDEVVQGLEDAIKQEFGNHGVSHSQQAVPPKDIKKRSPASDPFLCQVKTKEGLCIILKKGKIEASKTEVTVNTIFSDLALNKGAVSTAILNVAGPKLQQLVMAQKAAGTEGEIIITDGCNLKSQKVFHAVATKWDNGKGAAEQVLSGIFKGCLEKAENGNLTSISIPAIGTGNLGFPKTLVASMMLDKIVEFGSQAQPKHLKRVEIVIFAGDAPTIQEFTKEFMRKFPNASVGSDIKSSSQTTGPFSKVTSSTGMHETTMGNVTIQVITGDITKETTDVIVNSSDEKFTLKSGVSKAILDAAGQAVEQECQTCGAQPNSGMILTQSGNLKCKKILHLTGQTDPVKVQKVVKDALGMCAKQSFTSVSFPAIGTGQGNVQAGKVADAMLDAVIDVLSQNPSSTLKTVRIIIFQQQMLKDFYNSMQQREAGEQQEKATVPSSIGQRLKSLFLSQNEEKQKKEDDISIVPVKPDPACFHICGGTQSKVNAAKKWITDLISNEQTTIPITDNAILDLSKADCQHINGIQKKMGVTIQMENKNSQTSLIVEGLSRDVIKALREIDDILKKVKSKQELDKLVELTGAVADWQYQLQGQQFQSFDPMTNYKLEQAMQQELPSVNIKVQGQDYTATLPEGPATDKKGNTLQIKRIDKLKGEGIPEHWQQMPPKTTCLVANVQAGTPEYNEVLQLFQASCKRNVIKIDRIQNPALWRSLQIKRSELEVRNGHQNNEKRLFHGTSEDTVKIINERGFNRVYAGKNAAYFGNGTYFAVNASYSAQDTYSKPNANGEKIMYLCRVLTGDYTLGQQHMIAPPAKSSLSIELFDSVVDKVANPSMFVIFHDTQAYPEYLITFK